MGWVVITTLQPVYSWEWPGTHWIGGRVGSRVGPEARGKPRPPPHQDSIPGPCSPWQVAIPTELSQPLTIKGSIYIVTILKLRYVPICNSYRYSSLTALNFSMYVSYLTAANCVHLRRHLLRRSAAHMRHTGRPCVVWRRCEFLRL
jgi:hypothetical protein